MMSSAMIGLHSFGWVRHLCHSWHPPCGPVTTGHGRARRPPAMSSDEKSFQNELRELQIELVKYQRELIASDKKLLVILEGRDAAGKDGTIKCIVEHLS
ncbi:MAG: hypothetical protein AB7I68_13205, partial [Porticoccaceae bacterium]